MIGTGVASHKRERAKPFPSGLRRQLHAGPRGFLPVNLMESGRGRGSKLKTQSRQTDGSP